MFHRLKKLYEDNKLTAAELDNAVKKGWISKEEKQDIISPKTLNK